MAEKDVLQFELQGLVIKLCEAVVVVGCIVKRQGFSLSFP